MTTENLTEKQRRSIRIIIQELELANITFDWEKTKEGDRYWKKVYNSLKRIANSKPKGAEKEIELNGRKYRLVEE